MDAITLLKDDHKTVERLFKQFEKAGDRAFVEKRRIVDQIIEELSVHASIEEQYFYPATRATVPETEDIALESLEEHHIVKWLLSELTDLDPTNERFDAKVTVLMENVRHHVKEEEGEYFPMVRKELSRAGAHRHRRRDGQRQEVRADPARIRVCPTTAPRNRCHRCDRRGGRPGVGQRERNRPRWCDRPPGSHRPYHRLVEAEGVADRIESDPLHGEQGPQDRPTATDGVEQTASSVKSGVTATAKSAKAGAKGTATSAEASGSGHDHDGQAWRHHHPTHREFVGPQDRIDGQAFGEEDRRRGVRQQVSPSSPPVDERVGNGALVHGGGNSASAWISTCSMRSNRRSVV